MFSKTCLKQSVITNTKIGFQDRLSLNTGQSIAECSLGALQNALLENSAILFTFIKLPFKTFVLSIFEWPLKTCFTELSNQSIKERRADGFDLIVFWLFVFCVSSAQGCELVYGQ